MKAWRMAPSAAALACCALSSATALAYNVGQRTVTGYSWSDNTPSGDAIAKPGRHNYRAHFSTVNSYDNPSSMAVSQSYLDGSGPGGYFVAGDKVYVDGLGWFVVEDLCAGCDDVNGYIDAWTGFASTSQLYAMTESRAVQVFHPNETVPSGILSSVASSDWGGASWVSPERQRPEGAGTAQIYIDGVLGPRTHTQWGDELVDALAANSSLVNQYSSPPHLYWAGHDGRTYYENVSLCNQFVRILFETAYRTPSDYFVNWLGGSSPQAERFYDAIESETNFVKIDDIADVRRGHIFAVQYEDGSSTSGHVAVIDGTPTLRTASAPLVANTTQYDVPVIDSSNSYHGSADTRYGTSNEGAGRGTMRFYVDGTGTIVGYTWSTFSNSDYHNASTGRPFAVGRFRNQASPALAPDL